jgi:hypothetical protein
MCDEPVLAARAMIARLFANVWPPRFGKSRDGASDHDGQYRGKCDVDWNDGRQAHSRTWQSRPGRPTKSQNFQRALVLVDRSANASRNTRQRAGRQAGLVVGAGPWIEQPHVPAAGGDSILRPRPPLPRLRPAREDKWEWAWTPAWTRPSARLPGCWRLRIAGTRSCDRSRCRIRRFRQQKPLITRAKRALMS